MLKWAVYGKKSQDIQVHSENEHEEIDTRPYDDKLRRSLDAQSVKKSKKPSRYQRRSLGAASRKSNVKNVDKENIHYIGNTPNYFKEGFVKKLDSNALKDVSNITPTSVTPNFERRKFYYDEKEDIPPDLPPTPPTYSRRVREAKKRKLEMTASNNNEVFSRNSAVYKSERRIKPVDRSLLSGSNLSHSVSEPSLNDLSERLSMTTESSKSSFTFSKQLSNVKTICTTKAVNEDIAEIEYDKDLVINCIEKPLVDKSRLQKSTLPIFGHRIFTDNPLYFNKNEEDLINIKPLKRTRKKSNEFESSFKSPSIDKRDVHTLVRDGCSPVSVTPLSIKLAALRFSAMSAHTRTQREECMKADVTQYFPKVDHPFTISLKDEEISTEMENKFILGKDSLNSVAESTVSTTEMGDITLEKMIEDIIKSTKIIKSKRRIIQQAHHNPQIEEDVASKAEAKDLFVNPQTNIKSNLIKEAKCVNISRENSVSPKSTPTKKLFPFQRDTTKLLKNVPIGGFILDDGDGYNEREVRTPDDDIKTKQRYIECLNRSLMRSRSMTCTSDAQNLENMSSESTPDLYLAVQGCGNNRLRRQKCIRRKKSTVSNDSQFKQKQLDSKSSILTQDMEIPSPVSASPVRPVNASHNDELPLELPNTSLASCVSHSSLKPCKPIQNIRPKELFGLNHENGIPSPITPIPNLKRTSNILSEERAHKTSKLYEDMLPNDIATPVIEHRSSRRCLTYSPEENSISSSEEKRGSIASNRLERSADRFQALKGTIDLEIITKNELIDVHVIRCRDLQRSSGKVDDINAYAKVVISGVTEAQSLPSQRSIFQRTSVLYGKREPEFQRHLKLPLPSAVYDHQMLHISVWHRDKKYRRSEFLGCVSFPLKDAIKSDISGTYFLQQATGRQTPLDACSRVTEDRRNMATDNTETSTNDGTKENTEKDVAANGPTASQAQVAAALQREADEHLFLRYLELDPPEDPTAPRRTQRNGRTPFTTTRKLVRGTGGGFGFTVVWTRPPRIERVAAGGAAERAGLRAGDYIVFVGNRNVVTASEEEVRNLVKSAGQTLHIETFRRVPQNGIGVRPRAPQTPLVPHTPLVPPAPHVQPAADTPPPRSPRAALASPAARAPTACSSTSQSLDRRKLHLPQVTFSKEVGNGIIV